MIKQRQVKSMADIDPKTEVAKPKRISADGQSVEQRSISEIKEALALDAQISMSRSRKLPIRLCRFSKPGTV